MTDPVIRLARPEDAAALGELGRRTFIDTFVTGFGIPYPKAALSAFLDRNFDLEPTLNRISDPDCALWVAEKHGDLLAFANVGPCGLPHPEARPTHMELRRLYVSKSAQGWGLGTRLMALSLDWMQTRSDGPLWIGVWSGNEKARKLYAAHGFEKAGEYDYPVGDWLDREFILRRNSESGTSPLPPKSST